MSESPNNVSNRPRGNFKDTSNGYRSGRILSFLTSPRNPEVGKTQTQDWIGCENRPESLPLHVFYRDDLVIVHTDANPVKGIL